MRVSDHLANDTGTLNEWSLEIELSPGTRTIEKTEAPNLAIPDHKPSGVSSHVAVNEEGTAQSH